MKTLIQTVCLLSVLLAPAWARAEGFDPAAQAKLVAPFIDEQTVAVVRVNLAKVDLNPLFDEVEKIAPEEIRRQSAMPRAASQGVVQGILDGGVKEVYAVITMAGPLAEENFLFLVFPASEGSNEDLLAVLLAQIDEKMFAQRKRIGSALVVGSEQTIARLAALKPDPRPELEKGFAAAGDTAAQGVFLPPKYSRRVLEELLPTLPEEIGGGPSSVLTRGVLWASAGVTLAPDLGLRAVIQSEDAASAEAFLGFIRRGFALIAQQKEVARELPNAKELLDVFVPQQQGDQLVLDLNRENQGLAKIAAVLQPAITEARASAHRMQAMNNLRQIGIAMHNYHEAKKTFPPAAVRDASGKPLLSWRVLILPYVDESGLFEQFHLDEPWDSPHNIKLLEKMPAAYRSPASKLAKPGYTNYLVPVGPGTVFEGAEGTKIQDITDGTSNTIMLVEASDAAAVPWTKPDDWPFDPANPAKDLAGLYRGFVNVLFCDASARALHNETDPETLRRMFQRNDGKPVEWK
ncbi:MAG: DUF1559 domain-containing protein [Pirellulales bacterium]|nr:DUF1559 domain-containing protein [Pirellulales bacterium]